MGENTCKLFIQQEIDIQNKELKKLNTKYIYMYKIL